MSSQSKEAPTWTRFYRRIRRSIKRSFDITYKIYLLKKNTNLQAYVKKKKIRLQSHLQTGALCPSTSLLGVPTHVLHGAELPWAAWAQDQQCWRQGAAPRTNTLDVACSEGVQPPALGRLWDGMKPEKGRPSPPLTHLHHELPAAREASFCEECVLWLLLLFGLLDLGQSANWVHHLAIFWATLYLRNN